MTDHDNIPLADPEGTAEALKLLLAEFAAGLTPIANEEAARSRLNTTINGRNSSELSGTDYEPS